jgi:hypothetical protein
MLSTRRYLSATFRNDRQPALLTVSSIESNTSAYSSSVVVCNTCKSNSHNSSSPGQCWQVRHLLRPFSNYSPHSQRFNLDPTSLPRKRLPLCNVLHSKYSRKAHNFFNQTCTLDKFHSSSNTLSLKPLIIACACA